MHARLGRSSELTVVAVASARLLLALLVARSWLACVRECSPASWKDPEGVEITQRTKEQAIAILAAHRQAIVEGKATFADLAKKHSGTSRAHPADERDPAQASSKHATAARSRKSMQKQISSRIALTRSHSRLMLLACVHGQTAARLLKAATSVCSVAEPCKSRLRVSGLASQQAGRQAASLRAR